MDSASVLFVNDKPVLAVTSGDVDLNSVMDQAAKKEYEKQKGSIGSYEEYRQMALWHWHTVPVVRETNIRGI